MSDKKMDLQSIDSKTTKFLATFKEIYEKGAIGNALVSFQKLEGVIDFVIAQIIFPGFPKPTKILKFLEQVEFFPKMRYLEGKIDGNLHEALRQIQRQRNEIMHASWETRGNVHAVDTLKQFGQKINDAIEKLVKHMKQSYPQKQ